MNQLIITVVYDPDSGEARVSVIKLGDNKAVNLKELLLALHAAEGQYIEALEAPRPSDQAAD
jgi:hypothetical protein